jgi:hypothetical protein
MKTVKGKWVFNDFLTEEGFQNQEVNFISNNTIYNRISITQGNAGNAPFATLNYDTLEYNEYAEQYEFIFNSVYNLEDYEEYDKIGWDYDEAYKTIDFGEEEQEVSDEFYAWFIENAKYIGNTIINITENGTTTLATAGTYCDRNIDVNVEVEDSGAEVFAGMAQGTIAGDYTNEEITSLRAGAFFGCNLSNISLPNCTSIGGYSFRNCPNLESVNLPSCVSFTALGSGDDGEFFRDSRIVKSINIPNLTTIENGVRCFNQCRALEEFDAPNLTSVTNTSTMFSYCTSIKKINLPKLGGTTIAANTFPNCYKLETLILGGSELNPLANVNAFNNTGLSVQGGFKIYVPDNLVDAYKTATNWSNFADKIKSIEKDLEE